MTERLFVAAWPDAATAALLGDMPRPDQPGVRWVRPEHWHVTLRFLGECDRDAVVERLSTAAPPTARAVLGPAVDRLGPQVVVPVGGVDALAAAVHRATADIGQRSRRHFRGHLTLARTRRGATSTVVGHPVSGAFDVREIVLVRSELGATGSRYTTIAVYPTG